MMKRAPKQLIPYTGKRVMITLITLIIRQVAHRLLQKVTRSSRLHAATIFNCLPTAAAPKES